MNKTFEKKKFFFKPATLPEIIYLINCLDTNKAAGIDSIPPKLSTRLLTVGISKSIEENIFLDSAKNLQ